MNRLLWISYCFPPQRGPESLLNLRTVRALDRLEWQVTVLTVEKRVALEATDEDLLATVPSSCRVVRVISPERLFFATPLVRLVLLGTFGLAGLPETQHVWYPWAVRAGKRLLRSSHFDAIHSWACYHTSNVVGLALKRATGLPWVAHFSDPWLDNPYLLSAIANPRRRARIQALEGAIIREADAVVFTTRQTVNLVMGKYPAVWRQKVHVIPHGYDTEALPHWERPSQPHSRLRLVYTGNFYPGMRTPESLLRALRLLKQTQPLQDRLEVTFVGQMVKEYQEMVDELDLANAVEFVGPRPYVDSLQAAAQADVLVVIDASNETESVFLPSKIVDYLMFKKPILGLTPLYGASADLLRRLECPVVPPDDVPAIAQAISNLLGSWRSGQLGVSPAFEGVAAEYDICQTTRALDGVLWKVTNQSERQSDR